MPDIDVALGVIVELDSILGCDSIRLKIKSIKIDGRCRKQLSNRVSCLFGEMKIENMCENECNSK